jgi:hypothetical protein
MLQNIVDFKAKSFLSERNTSTMAYEVKAVRAMWDPSLSIPGTNRRGGWRCPTGTRYGGQITDRFGRSCGWGVARRIANQISDIGQRLENVDDARRGRRIARRERRILARLNPQGGGAGRLERGLRGVADRLEVADTPSPRGARRRTVVARQPSVAAPATPRELTPTPPAPRAPQRRRAPNVRESEQRRMDREIEQPGAPRTGEAPARRRRRAVVEATKKPKAPKQEADNAVDKPVVEPKIVKPRRPKKNPEGNMGAMLDAESEQRRVPKPAQRGDSDNAARSEELRQNRQAMELAVLADAKKRQRARAAGQKVDLNQALGDGNFQEYLVRDIIPNDRIMIINDPSNFPESSVRKRSKRDEARQKITISNARLELLQQAIERGELSDNDFVERNGERINIARVKTYLKDYRDSWQEVLDGNLSDARLDPVVKKPNPIDDPFNAPSIPKPKGAQNAPKEIAYEPLKFEPAFKTERNNILEEKLLAIADPRELALAIAAIDKLKFNHGGAQQNRLNRHHDELAKAINEITTGAKTLDQALASWRRTQETNFGTDERLAERIAERQASYENRWSSVVRGGDLETRINALDDDNQRLVESKTILALRQRFEKDLRDALARKEQGFVVNEDDTNFAKITPDKVKAQVDADINKAISKRGKKLDEYLKQRFPEGGAVPKFKDMTPEKWNALSQIEKRSYIEEAYSHPMIKGKNGKLYRVKVTEYNDNRGEINVRTSFDEIDANGNVLRSGIAGSYRTIYPGDAKKVYQNSFFIRSDIDKAADLATIYNQTAFTYLKAIGINKAGVGPADDGRYVWARVGFKERGGLSSSHYNRLDSALKFYKDFGVGGLVANDEQYIRLKKLVEAGKNGRKFNHQDAIFLIDDGNIADVARREYIKHWFATNVPLSSATLSFSEQKIGAKAR